MTDRELLEKAAKAAGYDDAKYKDFSGWGEVRYGLSEAIYSNKLYDEFGNGYWNPLEDDGDALRLAVKLKISVTQFSFFVRAEVNGDDFVEAQSDLYAATRRAIVRAAAAIGETL